MKIFLPLLLCLGLTSRPLPTLAEEASSLSPTQAIDSRLAGKPPWPGAWILFVGGDMESGGGFKRNFGLWCVDLESYLTCFSPWNSSAHGYEGGTLVTPKHAVFAEHFSGASGNHPLQAGDRLLFVSKANITYTRTLKATPKRVGMSDVCVGDVNEADLPPDIIPAQVLGAGPADKLLPAGTPVIFCNKNKEARVAEIVSTGGMVAIRPAVDPVRKPWTLGSATDGPAYIGDSGSPIFAVIDGRPVLLALFLAPNAGPRISDQIEGINAIVGPRYKLDVRKL